MIGPDTVHQRLTVDRVRRVQEDQPAHPPCGPVRRSGDDHAAVAVAHENDVVQVLEVEHGHDVLDVAVQVDPIVEQVSPLAQTREGGRVHVVALRTQQARDAPVAPPTVAAAVDQDIGRHRSPPSPSGADPRGGHLGRSR